MDKKIKMLVIPSDKSGCGKFRSVDPHAYIGEHYKDEFDVDIMYNFPDGVNIEEFLRQYDIIHIHKQLDPGCQIINMCKFLGIKVIVDVDDNFKLGNDHPMSLTAKKERWHEPIINHLKLADCVTTTTPIYAKLLKQYNKNVQVFPNAIDPTEKQYAIPKTQSNKMRVGIICGSSHLKDIQLLGDLVSNVKDNVQILLCGFDTNGTITMYNPETGEKTQRPIEPHESVWHTYEKIITGNYRDLSKEHVDFLMKFMKNVDDPFESEKYRRMWTRDINNYATHYKDVDVLIAPLKENEFNAVKSQLKLVEAGFTHTAIIMQNFGPYTIDSIPMIEKGGRINENGNCLLVDTRKNHKDWIKYINKLADNPDMLKKLQDNLYEYVKDRYSIETVCKQRAEFYKELINGKKN